MRILAGALVRVAGLSAVGASLAMIGAVLAMVGASLAAIGPIDMASGQPAWTTYHRDPQRSGDDPEATQPIAPVRAWQSNYLGAPIWSQPLVWGARVYVATVGDRLYALSAATGAVEWERSAGTPVPSEALPCGDIEPTVGIVGTPVIDAASGTIFVVADTWDGSEAHHVLEGYSASDGEQVLYTPVDPPGADPLALLQRTALNLDQGNVIFGFGGNDGDCSDYRGTVIAAPESGGPARFWQVPIAPPSQSGGAVWAPSGPTVDGEGNVYATTGNPDPPPGEEATTYDYSDSVVKLDLADFTANPLSEPEIPLGWFEPPSWRQESNNDLDLSSADAELLPGGLLFQAGKDGVGYLIDEAAMNTGAEAVYSHQVCGGHGSFGGDAYAEGTIYIACTNGVQALAYNQAERTFTPLWQGPEDTFGPPIVSAGLVWVLATGGFSGGGQTLYGLDPATGQPRYTETLPSRIADHFASPSAAGGRLFVASGSTVTAYQIAQIPGVEANTPGASGGGNTGGTGAASTTGTTGAGDAPPRAPGKHARVPTLVHTHLHVGRGGRVRITLRCPPAAGRCRGTVALLAKLAAIDPRTGAQGRRATTTLARARLGQRRAGDFVVVLRLGPRATALMRKRAGGLAVRVALTTARGTTRTEALLS